MTPRPSALKSARTTDGDATEAEDDTSNSLSPTAQTPQHPRPRETTPRVERAVVSRTRFHITLPTPPPPFGAGRSASGSEVDQRGWSSPHGEPYRPLGRPELNFNFSPQLVYRVSPMMQNAHRVRALEGAGASSSSAGGEGNSSGSEKAKELREPSSCTPTSSARASITTLVDQFVSSLTTGSRNSPLDDRQMKLAHRLQANVSGFSPERFRRLHRRQDQEQEFAGGGQQQYYQTTRRSDTSLQLLREAIDEGTSRLRSTRNGTNFLQKLSPSAFHGLHELHEQYLRARTKTPQPVMKYGSGGEATGRTSPWRHTTRFSRDEDTALGCTEGEDGRGNWYLPYTTRQLQRSPHSRLPSLVEFRIRTRDEKQPLRPLRASSNIKASLLPHRTRASAARSSRASLASARNSISPTAGTLITVGESSDGGILETAAAVPPVAASKGASSPFAMTTASLSSAPSVVPLHSIEKLQTALDDLEAAKCQQSAQLATALEMLEQDRYECLAGKFRSLHVRSDAVEDLKRMRERSERHRGQQVLAVVSKTADWYPEMLCRLLAREGANGSNANSNSGGLVPLHPAEHFIVQAVRRFTNDGCAFQSTQLFQVILHLHHDDLEMLQVQQLLVFLRSALLINHEEWTRFFAAHGLPEPIDACADDRKDSQVFTGDGKPCFNAATRHE